MSEQSLRDWHAKLAPPPEPCGEDATVDELRARTSGSASSSSGPKLEREILKKATAYFAKESL